MSIVGVSKNRYIRLCNMLVSIYANKTIFVHFVSIYANKMIYAFYIFCIKNPNEAYPIGIPYLDLKETF